jgi:hypothetical protein
MNQEQVLEAFSQLSEALRTTQSQQADAMGAVMRTVADQGIVLRTVVEQNAKFLEAEMADRRREELIDAKAVAKPHAFTGKEGDWPGWSFKFSTWISGQFQDGGEILEWAAGLGETPATPEKLEEVASKYPKAKILNQQIHAVLVSLTTTGKVAFDIVKGTKKNMGLDVWRKMNRKFDPNNPVANLRLLRKILRPSQVGMDQLISAIEQWEQDY